MGQSKEKIRMKKEMQEDEYVIPYHYKDLFAHAQAIERNCLYEDIVQIFQKKERKKILDVGCGDGRFCYYAKEYLEIEGLDLSERALSWAKNFNPEINFHNKSIEKLVVTEKYDGAVCLEVLEHISNSDIQPFLAGLIKTIKSNGTIVFSVPSINKTFDPKHFRHYDYKLLRNSLEPFFNEIHIFGYSRMRVFHQKVFSAMNIISLLCYSDQFCWKFPCIVAKIKQTKKSFWLKFLHKGEPTYCYRLVAICHNRELCKK